MNTNLNKAINTGEIITQMASVLDVDGIKLWYHSTIVPIKDDNDKLDYKMVVSLVTTKRKLEEEELNIQRDELE